MYHAVNEDYSLLMCGLTSLAAEKLLQPFIRNIVLCIYNDAFFHPHMSYVISRHGSFMVYEVN